MICTICLSLPYFIQLNVFWASQVALIVKNPHAMQETQARSLGGEDPLEKEMATHSSILAWKILWNRGAWWATVHGVTKNQTQLKRLTMRAQCLSGPSILLQLQNFFFSYGQVVFHYIHMYTCVFFPFKDTRGIELGPVLLQYDLILIMSAKILLPRSHSRYWGLRTWMYLLGTAFPSL